MGLSSVPSPYLLFLSSPSLLGCGYTWVAEARLVALTFVLPILLLSVSTVTSATLGESAGGAVTVSTVVCGAWGTGIPSSLSIASVPLFSAGDTTSRALVSSLTSIPSLEALSSALTLPRPSLSVGRAMPLVLSPALPPIPAKVVEKAQAGSFVELKDLLPDNIALLRHLHETAVIGQGPVHNPSRLREIQDPLTWLTCFLAFVAAKVEHKETRDLLAYGLIVVHLARKHGGQGWLAYDALFRQQLAAGAVAHWTDINTSLMASTVLQAAGDTPGRACSRCWSSDHDKSQCALASLDGSSSTGHSSTPVGRPLARSRSYRAQEICRRFNKGTCFRSTCGFEHRCSACFKLGHGAWDCDKPASSRAAAEPRPPPSTAGAKGPQSASVQATRRA